MQLVLCQEPFCFRQIMVDQLIKIFPWRLGMELYLATMGLFPLLLMSYIALWGTYWAGPGGIDIHILLLVLSLCFVLQHCLRFNECDENIPYVTWL